MKNEKLLEAITAQISKSLDGYFNMNWTTEIGKMLEEGSKFNSLVRLLDDEIELCRILVNGNCPAHRQDGYTRGHLTAYLTAIQKLAVLVHCQEMLLDERTTEQMRENIAYTLEKLYNIRYSEYLKEYIGE